MRISLPIRPAQLTLLGGAWLIGEGSSASGLVSLSLIDQVVLLGVAIVLPLALGGHAWWWAVAAAGTFGSFLAPRGWAAVLVLPFVAATGATLLAVLRASGPPFVWRARTLAVVLAASYAIVAAFALAQSRAGVVLLDLHEPIVELTCVHYIFAGAAALVLAAQTLDGPSHRIAAAAVCLTAAAPPVVAVGFVTGAALPQVGGAVLMTLGVWATATLQLRRAITSPRHTPGSILLGISGLAIWVPMILAVGWAAGQHWNIPVMSIPDMARTHGLINAFAFTLCGLVGWRMTPLRTHDRAEVMA